MEVLVVAALLRLVAVAIRLQQVRHKEIMVELEALHPAGQIMVAVAVGLAQ